ncbi:hypothetical protein LR948_13815 [Roseivivax sp. GX 12232]|uniref:hypothetical protein n=1 Tax=Roseivivax sp. GX 12232 TaxID=2900547 RepID=UPI001E530D30|nr:hypothetical protein [Roseivivax sp. GX 12232]MCE0506443.1 hypothetical protein [Roseivivax sp. GX 12232]
MTLATETPDRPRPSAIALLRQPLRSLSFRRLLVGGRLGDAGRLPRYAAVFILSAAGVWAPITGYLTTTPPSYVSQASLILPGSGASASVNLAEIGQASSYAHSAFANNSVSPTETYKRLIGADRILAAAAAQLGGTLRDFGRPRITLVDQTGLIHLEITGGTPLAAQDKAEALLSAFFSEIDRLREDELRVRADGGLGAIRDYQETVAATRAAITELQRETGLHSAEQYRQHVARIDGDRRALDDLAARLAQKSRAVEALVLRLGMSADLAAASLRLFADREYMSMLEEAAAQGATLADMRSRFGPRHPSVAQAAAASEAARAAALARGGQVTGLAAAALDRLDLSPDGARADLLAELVRLEAERAGLAAEHAARDKALSAETAWLAEAAPAAARLEDMQRDFDVAEAVFASAIARAESSKTDIYASYPLVQVLEDPSLPEGPSSPRVKLAIAAGVAAMIMLLIGLSLGWIRQAVIGRLIAQPEDQA